MTIARNRHKLIKEIFVHASNCRCFYIDDSFAGEPVDPEYALRALYNAPQAKLTRREDGKYVVTIHSNRWYEFESNWAEGC